MLGYIISDRYYIDVFAHKIKSFDVLYYENYKKKINIFILENNKILYVNNIIFQAVLYDHIEVLDWYINSSNFKFRVNDILSYACTYRKIKILNWFNNKNFLIEDKRIIYIDNFTNTLNHIDIFNWLKKNNYKIKYNKHSFYFIKNLINIKFFSDNINIKKAITWKINIIFTHLKFKTKNNYFKGYNKN